MVKNKQKCKKKYSQKHLGHAKESATDECKTASKGANKETAEETGKLFPNNIADKIARVWKTSQKNNLETVKYEHDKEIAKEIS